MTPVLTNRRRPALSVDQRAALLNQRALAEELSAGLRSPRVTPDGIVGREFVYHSVQTAPGWAPLLHGGLLFDPCQEDAVLVQSARDRLVLTKGPMDVQGWLGSGPADQQAAAAAAAALRLVDAAYDDGALQVSLLTLGESLAAAARMLDAVGPGAITPDWVTQVPADPLALERALASRQVTPWRHCT